jgi:hypothetical protein
VASQNAIEGYQISGVLILGARLASCLGTSTGGSAQGFVSIALSALAVAVFSSADLIKGTEEAGASFDSETLCPIVRL